MKVATLCEYSGRVRDAFITHDHEAVSFDLLPTESPGEHVTGDVRETFNPEHFDLVIAFPPCTYLANSGVRWLHEKPGRWEQMREGAEFFKWCLDLPVPRIAVENPVMHKYAVEIIGRRQDQSIQPWQFGHGEVKRTCLWLKNLPLLQPTKIARGREARVWRMGPSPTRWKDRSRTYQGIADAMAEQWRQSPTFTQRLTEPVDLWSEC